MDKGWVSIHRRMVDWEWYTDIPTKTLMIHCILMANHEDREYRGKLVLRGSFLTGRALLASQTGLSEQEVRTAMRKLINTEELTTISTSKGTHVFVTKYDHYQSSSGRVTNKATNDQPAINQQSTTNNNYNNYNNENNIEVVEDVDLELKEIQSHFNQVYGRRTESTAGFKDNYQKHWRKVHDIQKIKTAITNSRADRWWKDKMDLTILFRLKNPRGEKVDYIEKFANISTSDTPNKIGAIAFT
jgi:hypothetical protein